MKKKAKAKSKAKAMESDIAEIFCIKKQEHIRDIQDLLSHVYSTDELEKIIFFLENSQPKIKINTRKRKPQNLLFIENKSPKKKTSEQPHSQDKVTNESSLVCEPLQCLAYIQSGRQCSRKVRNRAGNYCGLHTVLHYGDVNTGFLNKNTI